MKCKNGRESDLRVRKKLIAHLLKNKESDILPLINALQKVLQNIRNCPLCFGWTEDHSACGICQNQSRDKNSLCVVENPFDIVRIEKSNTFQGYYHVLHGLISPLHNISPEDLTIKALIKKSRNKIYQRSDFSFRHQLRR